MKLKKLLAAVTAAALAVSTMAVTSFTASAAVTGSDWQTTSGNGSITYTLTAPAAAEGEVLEGNQAVSDASTTVDISSLVNETEDNTFRCVNVVGSGGSLYIQYPSGGPDNLSNGPAVITNKSDLSSVTIGTWWITPGNTQTITFTVEYGEPITKTPRPTAQSNAENVYTGVVSAEAPPNANTIYDGSAESILVDLTTILPEDFDMANVRKISADVSSTNAGTDGTIGMTIGGDWVSASPNWNNDNSDCSISTPAGLSASETALSVQIWHAVGGETVTATITVEDKDGNVYPAPNTPATTAEIPFDTTKEFELDVVDATLWENPGVTKAAEITIEKYPTGITKGTTYGKLKNTTVSVTGVEIRDTSIVGLPLSDVEVSVYAVWGAASSTGWDSTYVFTGSEESTTFALSEIDNVADDLVLKEMGYQVTILGDKGGINDMEIGEIVTVNSTGSVSEPVPATAEIAFDSTNELSLTVIDATEWGDPNVTNAAQLMVEVYPTDITKGLTYKKLKNTTLSLTGVDIRNTSIAGYPVENVAVEIFAEWNKDPGWTSSGSPVETWDLSTLAETYNLSDTAKLTNLGYIITITGQEVDEMTPGDIVKVNSPIAPVPEELSIAFDTDEIELEVALDTYGEDPTAKLARKEYVVFPEGVTTNHTFGDLKNSKVTLTGIQINNVDLEGVNPSDVEVIMFVQFSGTWKWAQTLPASGSSLEWDLSTIEGVGDSEELGKFGYQVSIYGDKVNALEVGNTVKVNSTDSGDDDTDRVYALLWEGTLEAGGGWGESDRITIAAEKLASLTAGDKIKLTVTPGESAQFKLMDGAWTPIASIKTDPNYNTEYNVVSISSSTYEFVVSADDISALKESGLIVAGQNFKLTKVELNADKKPTEKPPVVDPTHDIAATWSSDATGHWHACSHCEEKFDSASHIKDGGTVTTPATETTAGTKTYKCSVCGYAMGTEAIPATGSSSIPWYPPHNVGAPVIPTSGVKNNNAPTINGKDGWEAVTAEISAASDGDKLVVDMNSITKVPSTVFKAINGKDIDLVLNMSNGIKWTINGLSVTSTKSVDFGVTKNTKHIPNEVVEKAEGSHKKQISLDHNGSFGCNAVMTYDVGTQYNGLYANLFYYNRKAKELELIYCSPISGGKANFLFTHASDYLITISDEPLGDYEDVSSAAGIASDNSGVSSIALCSVLTVITLAFGFVVYKKRRHN